MIRNESDLDVIERVLREHPAAYIHTGPGDRTLSMEPVRGLIERLRKVEAELLEWRDGRAQDHIVQLERVREAAQAVITDYGDLDNTIGGERLIAALAALENP